MYEPLASARAALAALAVAATVAVAGGCAQPLVLRTASSAEYADRPDARDEAEAAAPPTVQVRYFWFSPVVSVVAWTPGESGYGLRAWIRRDGSLIMDHRIWVSTYYHPAMRTFPRAAIPSRPLLMTGISQDVDACRFGACSPFETFGARVPEKVLRTTGDGMPVRFWAYGGRELVITVPRDLIDAFLATVDAVRAELRQRTGEH